MYGYKSQRTCVLLGIGVQEREIQNAQLGFVNVIKVRRQKDIRMGKSQMDMCPFSYWKAREGNSECTGKFHQSPETKKKVICRSTSSIKARA